MVTASPAVCYDSAMKHQPARLQHAPNYRRQFWMTAARSLPHHTMLVLSRRLLPAGAIKLLGKNVQRQLDRSAVTAYAPADIAQYKTIAAAARLWHGTGRYQYAHGKVVDVLASILAGGSLNPVKDVYGIFVGEKEMVTISTTPLRIIARSYADTHGLGAREQNRYGSSLWWVAYYYSLFYGLAFTRYGMTVLKNLAKWNAASKGADGEIAWGKKVNARSTSVWDTFGSGSDIPGNYPILFGIARYGGRMKLPKIMEQAEVRLSDPISVADLSHIEVPEEKIAEVRFLLAGRGLDIPVFPIELGEYAASKQPFPQLIGVTPA